MYYQIVCNVEFSKLLRGKNKSYYSYKKYRNYNVFIYEEGQCQLLSHEKLYSLCNYDGCFKVLKEYYKNIFIFLDRINCNFMFIILFNRIKYVICKITGCCYSKRWDIINYAVLDKFFDSFYYKVKVKFHQ